MADISINKFRTAITRGGATPATPGFAETEGQDPVNPSGTGTQYGVGAGLSLDSTNRIQLGKLRGTGTQYVDSKEFFPTGFNEFAISSNFDNYWDGNFPYTYIGHSEFGSNLSAGLSVDTSSALRAGVFASANSLNTSIRIESSQPSGGFILLANSLGAKITDTFLSKGLENAGDYESNFTARSLVTKQYVDNAVSGGAISIGSPANGLSLAGTVLSLGLASSGVTGALSGTDWSKFNSFTLDNGLTIIGGASQVGNDITYDTAWQWRISNVLYSPASSTLINFPSTSSGFIRVDLVYGTNSGTIVRLAGTAVAVGTAATAPSLPANSVGIQEVTVIDTGIQSVTNFALASFVRFDVNNQGLTNTQRLNARTNIGAIGGGTGNNLIAYGNGSSSITGETNFSWDSINKRLNINGTSINQSTLTVRQEGIAQITIRSNTSGSGIFGTLSASNSSLWAFGDSSIITGGSVNDSVTIFSARNLRFFIEGSERIRISSGQVWIGTTSGTNTLDVNGTARIRTISNLGSTATRFLVASATGVISERTGAEMRTDLSVPSGSATTGQVAFWNSSTSISGENALFWDSVNDRLGINQSVPTERIHVNGNGLFNGSITSLANQPLFIMRDSGLDINALYLGATFDFADGSVSFGSFAINRNPSNGVFFNTGRAASQINLESRNGRADIGFYTSLNNNTTPSLSMWIGGNGNVGIGSGFESTPPSQRLVVLGNGLFGNLTSLGTSTPLNVSLGGTFGSNAAGTSENIKLFLYQDGNVANSFGLGVSTGLMEIRAGVNSSIGFFPNNGVELMRLITGGFVTIGVNAAPANTRMTVRGLGNAAGVTQLWEALDGTDNVVFLDNGRTQFLRLPTSSAGLGANDLWNDGGNVVIGTTQTFRDESTAKTTASADQTLPSGVLTILDYDTTVINNNTSIYTVGTTGRITVNSTGIYTITAGVVVEADAITALESAFLGIFRNGDLVAISSINTTIAAGAQSGLSTSTILSLTSGDIIDCRALVNSVGGVANGLARRLGTLLGANATQVNSLSITKSSQ
jgi:hypothetical protein